MADRDYRRVNVGSHVNPPPSIWVDYCPPEFRAAAPRLETRSFGDEGEYEVLVVEDAVHRMMAVQLGFPQSGPLWAREFVSGHPGNRDPAARLAAQDEDRIDAEVIVHPGFPVMLPKDRTIRLGMMYAFNSWLGEFCAHDPARLIGIGELPMWDMDLAVREAARLKQLGLRGVLVPQAPGYCGPWSSPADHPYSSEFYEPLWRALEENDLVMVVHADSVAVTKGLVYETAGINMIVNKTVPAEMIASLIVAKVFQNHPKLKLVCAETGVGWMAHLVSWMDVLQREQSVLYPGLDRKLSDYFHEHVFGSFLWETCGLLNKDIIGIDNMMWCNDFPHSYGPWPNSSTQIEQDLAGLGAAERHKVLAGNAVRVFNL